jgi:hypothetical protein
MAEATKLPYATCSSLEAMLSDGWRIEPPVYARPHWRSTSSSRSRNTYHFILWRDSQVNLVSIPESPEVQQFLSEYELAVDFL